MPHRYHIGQTVVPTVHVRELDTVYQVVQHLPEDATGAPQYRLRNATTGIERMSRESEMKAYVPSSTPPGRA